LVDAYEYKPEPPLDCPIYLLVGEEDATLSEEDLTDWRSEASSIFEVHRLPGSHFFFEEDRARFLAVVSSLLRGLG
jgi:surfactin synthase thioesterase subunit